MHPLTKDFAIHCAVTASGNSRMTFGVCVHTRAHMCVSVWIKPFYSNEGFLTQEHCRHHKESEVRRPHCADVPTLIIYV